MSALCLRQAWVTQWIPGWHGLQCEALFQKPNKETNITSPWTLDILYILFFIHCFLTCSARTSSLIKSLFSILSYLSIQPCHQELSLWKIDKHHAFFLCLSIHPDSVSSFRNSASFTHILGFFVHYTLVFFSHYQNETTCLEDAKSPPIFSWQTQLLLCN